MLGRCRLRRGVSLEVIVEEDDSAEVTFDPTPLMEEDDDDDDDEDSEHVTGGSAPGSPRGGDGLGGGGASKGGRGDEREEGRASAEERRRKRERRRTIGGLSRIRSVSCEALTLLDTSDMDSCCSEWDDDEDLTASNTGNYVTLNRPISRRRIIENCQSQCDSEDSGIEYHSNEDDHVLEDHSSNEDQVDMEEEEDQVMKEEEEEEEEDGIRTPSTQEAQSEDEDNQLEDQEEGRVDEEDDDEESTTITTQSDQEEVNKEEEEVATDVQEEDKEAEVDGKLSATRAGKEFFEEKGKESSKQERPTSKFAYSPNEALENDKIVIVETTPSPPVKKIQQSGQESAEEEMRLKREAYTIRNKEVRLAELPKPHIVKSVKQLFENLNTPVQHFHTWRDLGRFRDIKSNPSSKILRFDRSDGNDAPFSRGHTSLTLPRLPSQGGQQNTNNKSPKTSSSPSTVNKANAEVEIIQRTTRKVPKNYQETPMSRILTQSVAMKAAQQQQQETKSEEPLQQVKFDSGEKVVLRKPIVKGFNVKRALMENPRNFLHHNNTDTQHHSHHHNHHHHHHNHQQQRNSQRSIRQRSSGHIKKLHHHSEITDRSDTESLASDISDDSGVSNDSLVSSGSSSHSHSYSSSSSSSSSYRALDAYASDPSFKWIDPAVMAKIRSVGTTVIFFGPRQRPRQEGTLPRGGTKSISSGLQVSRGHHNNRGGQHGSRQGQPTNQSGKRTTTSRQQEQTNTPIPAPRIVGVVRKQSVGSTPNGNLTNPSTTTGHHLTPSPTPTETPSDDSRASSPASRCGEEASSGKAGKWREDSDTVVYNFTRPQPPAVYF